MFTSWRTWLKRALAKDSPGRRRPAYRLGVETLEDRTAPAALGGALDKLGSGLYAVLGEYQKFVAGGGAPAAFHSTQAHNLSLHGDKLLVEIHGQGDWNTFIAKLGGLSYQGGLSDAAHKLTDGYLPLGQVLTVAALPGTQSISPIVTGLDRDSQGTVANAAEGTLKADVARHLFGVDGTGITVGVMSDSANKVSGGIAASQATGNLPPGARVQDLLDPMTPADGPADEGRAMMELIYDIAPGVNLKFASGVIAGGAVTDASLANGINTLVNAGCNIIVDDLNGLTAEPYFQDGIAAQAVNNAVAAGIPYFSSQGNRGLSGYEAPFSGLNATVAGMAGRWQGFNLGVGAPDATQTITLHGGTTTFVFQYDDPFYGAPVTHDADFYILNAAGTAVLASGTTNNLTVGGDGIPREIVDVTVGATTSARIAIRDVAGGDVGRVKYIAFNSPTITNHLTEPGALNTAANPGHSAALGAIAVAAASVATPTTVESFSAQGPVTRDRDVNGNPIALQIRNKPDVTSNDGANTSVPGFAPFFGTSAAAPNAAAIGALIKQYNPGLTPAQLKALLMNTATDIGAPGPDLRTGAGLINAVAALQNTTGSPLLNGDFDNVNENDFITLKKDPSVAGQINVTVNAANLGFWKSAFVTSARVRGLGGNDTLNLDSTNGAIPVPIAYDGGSGVNTLTQVAGGNNTWTINGVNAGALNTFYTFTNTQSLTGTPQRDVFAFSGAGSVGALIDGNGGGDFLDYSGKTSSVVVNLTTGAATFAGVVLHVQNVIGSANGGDSLTGNAAGNVLVGHGSGNKVTAGSGRSVLIGGYGVNTIVGGASGDLIINGSTAYDGNYSTLNAILGIWQNNGQTYVQRLATLQAAGPNQLKVGVTVFLFPGLAATRKPGLGLGRAGTGAVVNSALTGGGGINDERNWFFTISAGTITDPKAGEVVTSS